MSCIYKININGQELSFNDEGSLVKYIRDNSLSDSLFVGKQSDEIAHTTENLAFSLRQMSFGERHFPKESYLKFQLELLDKFINLEEEAQYFYKIGAPLALTKGLGKNFDNIDNINKNLKDLGVGNKELPEEVPFDVRYLLTGDPSYKSENSDKYYHQITANNLKILKEIDALSGTMFMERTKSFLFSVSKVLANLKDSVANITDKVGEIKDEFSAFSQIAAYKQWISKNDKNTSTLRNSLIYDTNSGLSNIVDIAKDAIQAAPNNAFLKFILPVSTTIKTSNKKNIKNILNRDLLNTIEGKTRGRIEPDLLSSIADSFTELYRNPKTQFYAKALFDYLIVKDGLMFKNKSFIKMVPTLMFNDMSKATDIATKLMSANAIDEFKRVIKDLDKLDIVDREGNFIPYFTAVEKSKYNDLFKSKDVRAIKNALYEKVFGYNYNALYNKFEEIYATDVKNQFNLDLVFPKIKSENTTRDVSGIVFAKENDKQYMHVTLFSDEFKKLEKGSEERKQAFVKTLKELRAAGFSTAENVSEKEEDENKIYLNFKKFVRAKDKTGKYQLLQLVSVTRDKNTYSGPQMTVDGELVPRGTYAVYKIAEPVGASNSTGVADLGVRPTKDQLLEMVNKKVLENKPITDISQPKEQLTFQEEPTSGYKTRTIKNASADATIAIAVDFSSAGEKLTKASVLNQNKKYISIDANKLEVTKERVDKIIEQLNSINKSTEKINIYAGTGENADLSNFAIRPFVISGDEFQSVEQYFQYQKWNYLKEDITEAQFKEDQKVADAIMNTSNGATLKSLGRKFKNLDVQSWDKNASKEMKFALKASFEQNPNALVKLLATGNAELTHTQDKGKWGKEFPKLLMEVREELRGKNQFGGITLNIAGNGIYTMKGKYTQQEVDDFTYELLKAIIESPNLKNKIISIRTGGQTGFDEAGAKAAMRLGIPTLILAPKGWVYRDITGKDISDESSFKKRFDNVPLNKVSNEAAQNTIQAGTFSGFTQVPYDENIDGPIDFFTDEQINENDC